MRSKSLFLRRPTPTGCKHALLKLVASKVEPLSRVFKTGGFKRRFPKGGSAKGIPTIEEAQQLVVEDVIQCGYHPQKIRHRAQGCLSH